MNKQQIDNIPEEIRQLVRWMGMKLLPDQDKPGRFKKIPIDPKTGQYASSTNPATWGSFEQAIEALRHFNLDGIGFALGNGVFGIDIDHCLEKGQINPEVQEIINLINSYTEKSFSGDGIHILGFGHKPEGFKSCKKANFNNKGSDLEIYDNGRYFVMTGNVWNQRPLRDAKESVAILVKHNMPEAAKDLPKPARKGKPAQEADQDLSDDAVLAKVLISKKYEDLFNGEWQTYYPGKSLSEATGGLLWRLAELTNCNSQQMDRLFRSSGLMRDKWDSRRGSSTWGADEIQRTIEAVRIKQASDFAADPIDWQALKRPLTDLDVCREFAQAMQSKLIYTDGQGWLVWKDNLWRPGIHDAVRLMESFIDKIRNDAGRAIAAAETEEQLKNARRFCSEAFKLRCSGRIEACLKLACHELYLLDEQLDARLFEINTPDGVIDLKTGKIRPAKPDDYCTMVTSCGLVYTEAGLCLWDDFINQVTNGDTEYQHYLQVAMGQLIIGKVLLENLILAWGGGGNGKSTFFNTLFKVCGVYATGIDPDILLASRQNKEPALMALKGRRFVLASETEEGQRLSTAQLKKLASTDQITGRRLYHEQVTFQPSHTMVIYTNHLPKVSGTDVGTWSRIVVLPFTHKWDRKSKKTVLDYSAVLYQEAGGAVLSWLVEGARLFLEAGGHLPGCVALENATEGYRKSEDWLTNFISDACAVGVNLRCGANEIYQAYRSWSISNGEYVRRHRDFTDALLDRGFERRTPNNRKTWIGLRPIISDFDISGCAHNT